MLLLHLFDRENSSAKIGELGKLLLDFLQALVPPAVSDLRLSIVSAFTSILAVQLLQLRDLIAETADLFPKDFEVIHVVKHNRSEKYRLPIRSSRLVATLDFCRQAQGKL